jgi:hypothetical protein
MTPETRELIVDVASFLYIVLDHQNAGPIGRTGYDTASTSMLLMSESQAGAREGAS